MVRMIGAAVLGLSVLAVAAPAQARWVWYGSQWFWVQDQPVVASPWSYYLAEPWTEHYRHHEHERHEHEHGERR